MDGAAGGWGPGARVGALLVERELGRGAMGVVYQALDTASGERVALKTILLASAGPDAVARFRREGEAMRALPPHPNVLRVRGGGEHADRLYLVMDLAPGGDLGQRLARSGPLPVGAAVRLVADVARGLSHVHARGVLHRDIKPGNVLFAGDGRAVLADFGLARTREAERMTRSGEAMGTPDYMAPEQMDGGRLADVRSDVYSLGAVLFACLTGRPPYQGDSAFAVFKRVLNDPVPRVRDLRPEVPEAVAAACERALAKVPELRFQDARALMTALLDSLEDMHAERGLATEEERAPARSTVPWVAGVGTALVALAAGASFLAGVTPAVVPAPSTAAGPPAPVARSPVARSPVAHSPVAPEAVTPPPKGPSPAPPPGGDVPGGDRPAPAAEPAWGAPRKVCDLPDREVRESSGLAAGRALAGTFWTHNGSGDSPRLFAIDARGATRGTFAIEDVEARDWEDLCSFQRDGRSWLLVADTGDNDSRRAEVVLYLIEEPASAAPVGAKASLRIARAVRVVYEDGPHDCESVAVDPTSGDVLLVTRVRRGPTLPAVYAVPWPEADARGPVTARKVVDLRIPPVVTAMDVSPDGRLAVVLTHGPAFLWTRAEGEGWAAAFAREPRQLATPRSLCEAICFGPDGRSMYLTSEGWPMPLWELPER